MRKTEHRIEVETEPGPSETQHMIAISESLRQEIEELKTELAETHGRLMVDRWLLTRRADNIDNALRDMLAPTIQLLHDLQLDPDLADTRRVEEEIDRLKRIPWMK